MDWRAKVLNEEGFPPEYLELELTESALMERKSAAVVILRGSRTLGVSLAIDDFGTGYSTLFQDAEWRSVSPQSSVFPLSHKCSKMYSPSKFSFTPPV